jgi:hypothetical protein
VTSEKVFEKNYSECIGNDHSIAFKIKQSHLMEFYLAFFFHIFNSLDKGEFIITLGPQKKHHIDAEE